MKSKKLIIIEIVISVVVALFVSLIVIVFIQKSKSINEKVDDVIEETIKKESEIRFDMSLPPNEQKNLRNHVAEYIEQVYTYLYGDSKLKNGLNREWSYSQLKERGDVKNFYRILSNQPCNVIIRVFNNDGDNDISLSDLPVTENYIAKHPQPLSIEYKEYYKENYNISDKDIINNEIHKYLCSYKYEVGINEEKKTIILSEYKEVEHLRDDGTTYPAWGKEGSDLENQELSRGHIRDIVFKYKLSDNGYLDDVEFDHIINYMDDKYFDEIKS